MRSDMQLASHEAGHAVVMESLAPGSVRNVSIHSQGGDCNSADLGDIEAAALSSFAGKIAEDKYLKKSRRRRYEEYWAGKRSSPHLPPARMSDADEQLVNRFFRLHPVPGSRWDNKRDRNLLYRKAVALVDKLWDEIERVAQELVDKRHLERKGFLAAMNGTVSNEVRRGASAPAGQGVKGKVPSKGRPLSLAEMRDVRDKWKSEGNFHAAYLINKSIRYHEGLK